MAIKDKPRTRKDKKKNIAKVVKAVIADPLMTEREIAKTAGVGNGTAHRVISELERTGAKDDRILGITDADLEIVVLGQKEISRRLKDTEELSKMRTVEISQVIKENTARYSLFRGDATDAEGGLRSIESIEII